MKAIEGTFINTLSGTEKFLCGFLFGLVITQFILQVFLPFMTLATIYLSLLIYAKRTFPQQNFRVLLILAILGPLSGILTGFLLKILL